MAECEYDQTKTKYDSIVHPCRKDGSNGGRKLGQWALRWTQRRQERKRRRRRRWAMWRSKRSSDPGLLVSGFFCNFLGAGSFTFLCNFLGALAVRLFFFRGRGCPPFGAGRQTREAECEYQTKKYDSIVDQDKNAPVVISHSMLSHSPHPLFPTLEATASFTSLSHCTIQYTLHHHIKQQVMSPAPRK